MVNKPRRAGPPLPRLARPASGTLPATRGAGPSKAEEQRPGQEDSPERSGTRQAVRRQVASVAEPPRLGALFEAFEGKTSLRRNPLLARPAPLPRRPQAEAAADDSPVESVDQGAYRDSLPTIPAPEELESMLLAESRRRDSERASDDAPEIAVAGWSEFAPSHPPARKSHPELEYNEQNGLFPASPKTGFGSLRTLGSLESATADSASVTEGERVSSLHGPGAPTVIVSDPPPPSVSAQASHELASAEPGPRDLLDTIPPARRVRKPARRRLGAWLLATTVLAVAGAGGWSLFPERSSHAWRMLEVRADTWWRGVEEWLERVPR